MTQTPDLCDRCGRILGVNDVKAKLGSRELLLCERHAKEHGPALAKQGFTIEPLIPPDPVAGPRIAGACRTPECGRSTITRLVTASPTSTPVQIVKCQGCDSRTCNTTTPYGKCAKNVTNPADPICPAGHSLMGGVS